MFHQNLKRLRQTVGLSQKQIAEHLNISPQSVSKWEKGDSLPSIDYLPQMAQLLQCEINDFFSASQTNAIDILTINHFFDLKIAGYQETKQIDEEIEFALEHPEITDAIVQICNGLLQHKTIQTKTVQSLLACSKKEAQKLIEHFIIRELLEALDIEDTYLVIEDAINGFIMLLQSQERLYQAFKRTDQKNQI